jgi:hypothetical protein
MTEFLEILISWPLTLSLVFAVLRRDERRLTPAQLARAWPVATRLASGVYFGILCLPVHFWRTRRSAVGLLQGCAWAAGIAGIDEIVGRGVELAAPLWMHPGVR